MELVIFGTGDIARLAHRCSRATAIIQVVGFTVDRAYREGETFPDLRSSRSRIVAAAFPPSRYGMFVASATRR